MESKVVTTNRISYPCQLSESDWKSLEEFILSKTDRSLGSRFLRIEIRNVFTQLRENKWQLDGRRYYYNDPYNSIANSLKWVFQKKFTNLPKYLSKQDIKGLVVQWRLQVGK